MKIAVCFYGQVRTGVEAAPNIMHFLGEHFNSADFFVHTWDNNSTRTPLNLMCNEPPTYPLTNETVDKFKKIYKPVNMIIESQQEYWNRLLDTHGSTGDLVHLWHSAYHSNQLKKIFEDTNKFKYDYVIRMRPDCIFPPDRTFNGDLEEIASNPGKHYVHQLFGDTYQVATSNIMDIACDFYPKGEFYGNHFWPMLKFEEYMQSNGIEVVGFQDNRATILRHEFSYMDPIQHYWQINAINAMVFENINFAKDNFLLTYENLRNPNWRAEAKISLDAIFGNAEIPKTYFSFYKDTM